LGGGLGRLGLGYPGAFGSGRGSRRRITIRGPVSITIAR
jgi:hypothetical protein